jgi:hypothetical protein
MEIPFIKAIQITLLLNLIALKKKCQYPMISKRSKMIIHVRSESSAITNIYFGQKPP